MAKEISIIDSQFFQVQRIDKKIYEKQFTSPNKYDLIHNTDEVEDIYKQLQPTTNNLSGNYYSHVY